MASSLGQFPKWKVVVFLHGKRQWKIFEDARQAIELAKRAQAKGLKAHVVSRRVAYWPPEGDDMRAWDEGKLWCPYCRRWRFFSIPRYAPHAEQGSDEWFLNTYANQEVKICQWCTISVNDFYVKQINNLWGEDTKRRRKRRRRRK